MNNSKLLHVQQVLEGFEVFLGWETRNKYRILDENMQPLYFAAEQNKGLGAAIMRQFLGHWRTFEMVIFDSNKEKVFHLSFPFRWFFKTLYVSDASGKRLGHLQEKFAIFRKKFDVFDQHGQMLAQINSSFFKFWTFEFYLGNQKLGKVQKKWSGVLSEIFTDKDNFVVSFTSPNLTPELRALMLSTCLMVDIIYFENNQGKGSVTGLFD